MEEAYCEAVDSNTIIMVILLYSSYFIIIIIIHLFRSLYVHFVKYSIAYSIVSKTNSSIKAIR